ncbi:MAG TPA: SDR family oxidoreductase [Chloroflexota bacterium]|nr:SDR family oxidoreductase [Chloroflexota bacterium]
MGALDGKVAIITGSAKGIGRAVALGYAREGAKVVLADVDEKRLNDVAGEIGSAALPVMTDVRSEDSVKQLMARAAEHFGGIDVLVNDAGIVPHFQWGVPKWPRIRDMEQAFWDRVLDTNLGGTYLCTKHALPHLEPRRGHVISLHGGGGPLSCAYSVTKDAIRTFTRFVAMEEPNVCVVCVSPGSAIATEDAPEEARQRMPGPETVVPAFILAAQAGMDLHGKTVQLKGGKLEVLD